MSYAVRISYPARRGKGGKRDLVVSKPTRSAAVAYARKVARRGLNGAVRKLGRRGAYYAVKANAPTACVYNLARWGSKPACFRATRDGRYYHEPKVAQVPYTALSGLRSRR